MKYLVRKMEASHAIINVSFKGVKQKGRNGASM
jgi:hypothetical protein